MNRETVLGCNWKLPCAHACSFQPFLKALYAIQSIISAVLCWTAPSREHFYKSKITLISSVTLDIIFTKHPLSCLLCSNQPLPLSLKQGSYAGGTSQRIAVIVINCKKFRAGWRLIQHQDATWTSILIKRGNGLIGQIQCLKAIPITNDNSYQILQIT